VQLLLFLVKYSLTVNHLHTLQTTITDNVTSRGKQCRQLIPAVRKSHYRRQRTE